MCGLLNTLVCKCDAVSLPQAYKYLREEVRVFKGKPIMVRIKARTMAVNSYAPKNGFRPIQLDQGSDSYSPYLPGSTYQQPCTPNIPSQQLYDFTNEVWASAATGYPECSEVRNLTAVQTDGRRCWCHTAPVLLSAAFGVDERLPEWISGNFQLQTAQAEVDIHCHVLLNCL